jgi:antitoxin component of MazEF toxin-antitoxin module
MPYVKQLSKVGNSTALIIDRALLQQLDLHEGAEVELSIEDNKLVIQAHEYATDADAAKSAARVLKRHRRSLEGLAKR